MFAKIKISEFLIGSFVIGTIAAVVFIYIQPLLGMTPITERHAHAYIEQGGYGVAVSYVLAWGIHTFVSILYTAAALAVFYMNNTYLVSLVQIAFWGWTSTLIATPANILVIKSLVEKTNIGLSQLPPLNFELGPKLYLHLLFFVLVILGAYLYDSLKAFRQAEAID